MAELLGIVAGGAGLASLALQLVDGGQKLRQRYKNVKGLGGNILWLSEDIELIGKQLIQLETSADDIMQEQLGPIMMGRCRDRSARVADRLANLAGDIPVNSSRRQIIRTTFRSGQWKGELDELQALVTGLKQDISQYAIPLPAQHLYMRNSRSSLVTADVTSSMTPISGLSTEITPRDNTLGTTATYPNDNIQYSSCNCDCSCHKKRTISGTFWRLQYSPLAEIFQGCDNPDCSVRRYRFDIRLTLYQYGIPLKAALGLDLVAEPGRYSLQPCLQIETVVDFDAPGFVILENLALDEIDWVAAGNFEYTDRNGEDSKTITNLIQLFVSSFRTKETSHSAGLVPLPSHCYAGYVGSVDSLAALGCDFKNVVPTLSSWPKPFIYEDDPFHFQRMKAFIRMDTDFGDSPPLHSSTLFDSDESFMLCLKRNTQPFDTIVNFLGQSALHMAVQQPSRVAQLLAAGHPVDQSDEYGRSPLLYAAAMNIPDTAMMLVENGASLFSTLVDCLPIICTVAARQNWTLVWRIIDFAAASHPDLTPRLIRDLLEWDFEEAYGVVDGQHDLVDFWSRAISKLGSPNFSFQDGKTLMHMTHGVRSARALIKLGFTKFKQTEGDLLEHIASLHDLPLFRFAIANGGDMHLHKHWGWRILDMLLRDLALISDVDNDRFWDIAEQISIDELKKEMEDLATKPYPELKIEVMARLRVPNLKHCSDEAIGVELSQYSRTFLKLLESHTSEENGI
ncbi:hypothetical protein FPRO05_05799 [Fusarium proliferatum]|uniref:Uncharacterized protein n=1 Tax=Gibberella intermedia TaxID=948311 RepID=A0A365MMS3_GIBIN|nr:hypothetical protein FPRO05_05799 [Fusarium proliferatum]